MKKIKALYLKYKEIINYLIVGVLTTVVSFITYFVVTRTFLNPNKALELQIANIISWVVAVTFAYITNRIFVFESKNKNIFLEVFIFFIARVLSLLMDMGCMFIVVTLLKQSDIIGKLVSQVVVTIANYILSKLIVFRHKKDSNN